jgi:hypothetical protein
MEAVGKICDGNAIQSRTVTGKDDLRITNQEHDRHLQTGTIHVTRRGREIKVSGRTSYE